MVYNLSTNPTSKQPSSLYITVVLRRNKWKDLAVWIGYKIVRCHKTTSSVINQNKPAVGEGCCLIILRLFLIFRCFISQHSFFAYYFKYFVSELKYFLPEFRSNASLAPIPSMIFHVPSDASHLSTQTGSASLHTCIQPWPSLSTVYFLFASINNRQRLMDFDSACSWMHLFYIIHQHVWLNIRTKTTLGVWPVNKKQPKMRKCCVWKNKAHPEGLIAWSAPFTVAASLFFLIAVEEFWFAPLSKVTQVLEVKMFTRSSQQLPNETRSGL